MARSRFLIIVKLCEPFQRLRIRILAGVLLVLCLGTSGCSTPTEFRVLDAKTNKPVEGAVALATWTAYRGLPGLSYGYTAKAVEAVSDKNGYFTIPGALGTLAFDPPLLQVYKPTYVGWNSRKVYLGFGPNGRMNAHIKKRENFYWKSQDIYLQPWKDDGTMNHNSHRSFLSPPTGFEEGGIKESKYYTALRYVDDLEYQEMLQWDREK